VEIPAVIKFTTQAHKGYPLRKAGLLPVPLTLFIKKTILFKMILTVTTNPLLERRLLVDELYPGSEHRAKSERYTAGGKGINVSRQLTLLGVDNLAYTFIGGNNGRIFRSILTAEQINFTFVQTKNETRSAQLIIDEKSGKVSTFFGLNAQISQKEADEFKSKLRKVIGSCEMVIFSGSSPGVFCDDIIPFGIRTAHENDKISVCDTYGAHLKSCIESAPTIIHNNIHETEASLNISLKNESEITEYLDYLYSLGVKQSYLTNGKNPVYCSSFNYIYKAEPPEITELNATGSGDAFTSGIACGLHRAFTFEDTLAMASGLGAANALRSDVCCAGEAEYKSLMSGVKISTIGKKMRNL